MSRRIDEISQEVGSVHGTRDVIQDLKNALDGLRGVDRFRALTLRTNLKADEATESPSSGRYLLRQMAFLPTWKGHHFRSCRS